MCTSNRKIVNRTKRYVSCATRQHLYVPCGQCEECRAEQQNEWLLRICEEVNLYTQKKGKVIFFTLTYKNSHLPMFDYVDEFGEYSIPVFNHKDVKNFFKRIRSDFARGYCHWKGHLDKNKEKYYFFKDKIPYSGKKDDLDNLPIRYIVTSEYGMGKNTTRRPHYHGLLFLPPQCTGYFKSDTELRDYLEYRWEHGFVRKSKDYGWYVYSDFASVYTSKYMTKQLDFFENPKVDEFLNTGDERVDENHRFLLKRYFPRHFQSMQFGATLAQRVSDDDLINGCDFHLMSDINVGRSIKRKVPRYIQRKLMYNQENGVFTLNDYGIKIKLASIEKKIERLANKYKNLIQSTELNLALHNAHYAEFFPPHVYSAPLASSYFLELLNGRSFTTVALYKLIWQGMFLPVTQYEEKETYERLKSCDESQLLDFSLDVYASSVLNSCVPVIDEGVFYQYDDEVLPVYHKDRCNLISYSVDKVPLFKDLSYFIDTLDKVYAEKRVRQHKSYLNSYNKRKQTRNSLYDYR